LKNNQQGIEMRYKLKSKQTRSKSVNVLYFIGVVIALSIPSYRFIYAGEVVSVYSVDSQHCNPLSSALSQIIKNLKMGNNYTQNQNLKILCCSTGHNIVFPDCWHRSDRRRYGVGYCGA
jgi:hypothetical protein